MEQVTALLVALVAAFGPLAIGVTKLVDGARNLFDKQNKAPKWTWNAAALILAEAVCLLFGVDVVTPIAAQVPAFVDKSLDPVVAQILTGIGVAGMASYWHESMSATSAKSP